ncbi:unnamed protein product [Paramecium primaurelia]|uniref:Uncharacterized protein n=1 Tax=Paramecium primaurelia TaxID=5886 RepID=A0A8S1KDV5_PARPR|nr:unnamed protein product [Paramecium primaurelia]
MYKYITVLIIRIAEHQLLFSKLIKIIKQFQNICHKQIQEQKKELLQRLLMEFGFTNLMKQIAQTIIVTESQADRQIHAMIRKQKKNQKKYPGYVDAQPSDVEKYTKIWMKQLQEKYDNLAGVYYAAQQKVYEVQIVMEGNIHNIIKNWIQFDNLDEKAENLIKYIKIVPIIVT